MAGFRNFTSPKLITKIVSPKNCKLQFLKIIFIPIIMIYIIIHHNIFYVKTNINCLIAFYIISEFITTIILEFN